MTRVLVLANSEKLSGRCVAGIDLSSGRWLRPVSARATGELAPTEYVARTGSSSVEVVPGDVVEMSLGKNRGSIYHPEDVQVNGSWTLVERWTAKKVASDLDDYIERNALLLGSTGDRLAVSEIGGRTDHSSLQLIRADLLTVHWTTSMSGNAQLRGTVRAGDVWENLSITDPRLKQSLGGGQQPTKVANCLLTISLAVPFRPTGASEDYCFKIIAAVLPL